MARRSLRRCYHTMNFLLPITLSPPPERIRHSDKILLLGSCFTEHISSRLAQGGFAIASNPQGILFNPVSTAQALENVLSNRRWQEADLFPLHGLWNSWQHHSRFSHIDAQAALAAMNAATSAAFTLLQEARWIIITLGTSFQYVLREGGMPVANNHRAPGQHFEKKLLSTEEIVNTWRALLEKLFAERPAVRVVFTVSPVRHARDGAVANNRSKGRLLDAVHTLCEQFPEKCLYFPAYELVVDVLRDYRFYDLDLIHPNHAATSYVWEQFVEHWMAPADRPLLEEMTALHIARTHRSRFPETAAHQAFLAQMHAKALALQKQHPRLDLGGMLRYFETGA